VRKDDRVNRWQFRRVVNLVNGSTALGCLVATAGRARITRSRRGLLVATGYRPTVPVASAFTVGNVIVSRHDRAWLDERPALMRHEERHTWQYVACLGLPMLPLYLLAAGWSYLRGGDVAAHNPFERLAGLEDGGYPAVGPRARPRAQPA
jgi:hypothetical protein